MGQFSVKIYLPTGSVLNGNQQSYIITYIHLSAGSRVPRTVNRGAWGKLLGPWQVVDS